MLKAYGRGFLGGILCGAVWLLWVYWRSEQFPGDPTLNRYYARLRGLEEG